MFVVSRTQESRLDFHFHKGMEILLTLSDGGKMYINNAVYPITRGSLFVMNNMDFHRSEGEEDNPLYRYCAINFAPEEVAGMSAPNFNLIACFQDHRNFDHRYQLTKVQLKALLKQIDKLKYYLAPDCPAYGKDVYSKLCLGEILIYVNSLYESAGRRASLPKSKNQLDRVIPIVQYIQEHYAEDLSTASLANIFFFSKAHL